ncbi:MAG: C40 family peptidase [Bacteroidia bacterium]|nr:C40 family peptidase [Bacteroidia bacterium]
MEVIDHGVCRLALVSVRKGPSEQSEQVTQLLFGDHYEVTLVSEDKKWTHIRIHADLYEGWINEKQHHSITKEFFEQINHANYKISTDLTSSLLYKKSPLTILIGSIVPISNSELFRMEEQFAFNGDSKSLGQKRDFEFLSTIAFKYLNAPYQWGGKGPFGIDCSAFTQMIFKISGYQLLRDASQQANHGKKVATISDAHPGDLAFFQNPDGLIVHVGIILTEGKIIHASGKVRIDYLTEEGILNSETKIYTHQLAGIRRILTNN